MDNKNLKEYVVTITFSYHENAIDEEAAEEMALTMFEEEYSIKYFDASVSVEKKNE